MKKPTALITGIAGFAGSYLAEDLLAAGYRVAGTLLPGEAVRNIKPIRKQLELHRLNILNADRAKKLVTDLKPDYIFHLAALASVAKSFDGTQQTFRVNFDGSVNLLEAARQSRSLRAFVLISSSDVYGRFRPSGKTLTENEPLDPISPYGISKAAAEQIGRYYQRQFDLPVITVRAFNHNGPRQANGFAVPSFARQIARIEAGEQKPILKVGDLTARRDLSDVRDIVTGYRQAAEKGQPGEVYQLCSGRAVSLQSVVNQLLRMSHKNIRMQVDPGRLRKSDIPVMRGCYRKASEQLGYRVRYTLKDTLAATLEYWRAEVGDGSKPKKGYREK